MSELNVLPENWTISTLGECCFIARGGSPRPIKAFLTNAEDGVNWIKIGDATASGKYIFSTKEKIKPSGISNSRLVNEGDFLLSNSMSFGRPYIMRTKGCIHDGWLVLSEYNEYFDQDYLYHLLSSPLIFRQFNELASGSTVRNLNIELASQAALPIPPITEQHRIVAKIETLFSELDKGIESFKTAREQLKIYRQALLKHAFSGKLTEQWRAENQDKLESAEALLQRIQTERQQRFSQQLKDWEANGKPGSKPKAPKTLPPLTAEELAELPELPEGWVYSYLADLGELGRGKSKHRPRNDPRLFGGNFPFIQTGEVKAANRIIREFTNTLSDFGLQQSKLWPTGTLCITIAANIAETAFLGFDGCFPDSVVGFSAFKNIIAPEYVDFFIQAVRSRIEAYAPATAQKNINLETLENLVVPYCCSIEQKQIIDILDERFSILDQFELSILSSLQQAEALRQSILKKAFSGQLVPQDPCDEPASLLLERIRAEKAQADIQLALRRGKTARNPDWSRPC
jgi:type I restriction enzyme S subunit